MTNFVFDARAEVELQDEVRFMEVTRGHSSFSFMPPLDMVLGERLRLTAYFGAGASQQRSTFTLVAHSGRATHQVEVYRDQRPRESYQHEVAQERAKTQRLREELEQLRVRLKQVQVQLAQSGGLRDLIASDTLSESGVQALHFSKVFGHTEGVLSFREGVSYRATRSVATEVSLANLSSEPWTATEASLVDAQGKELVGLKLRQEKPIQPLEEGSVIVELKAMRWEAHGELKLTLRDEGSRAITLVGLTFP